MWGPLSECSFASVYLSVSERVERKLYLYKTPMYFNYIACFVYIMHIMLFGIILHLSFNFGNHILNTYQN